MSNAFQYVFDNATSISISVRPVVGQTITRNLSVKAVSRGPAPRRFTVRLPDGPKWSDISGFIQDIDAAGRFTVLPINIDNPGYVDWIDGGDIDPNETIDVICVEMPTWTIFSRDQVSWSGAFVFYEVL